jgi:hypothetical protein
MDNLKNDSVSENGPEQRDRRTLLVTGLGLAATPLLTHGSTSAPSSKGGRGMSPLP